MGNYVNGLTSLSNSCLHIPGNQYLCIALGVVGIACMAWGLSIVMGAEPIVVKFDDD